MNSETIWVVDFLRSIPTEAHAPIRFQSRIARHSGHPYEGWMRFSTPT